GCGHPEEDAVTVDVPRLNRVEEPEASAAIDEEGGAAARAAVDERHRVGTRICATAIAEGVIGDVWSKVFLSGLCAPFGRGAAQEGDDVAAVADVDPQRPDAAVEAECDRPRSLLLSGCVMAAAAYADDRQQDNNDVGHARDPSLSTAAWSH